MSGPAGSNKVDVRSKKGIVQGGAGRELEREVLESGAIPAAEHDNEVRRLRRGADDAAATGSGSSRRSGGRRPSAASEEE